MLHTRRGLIVGLAALVAAPAIVRATSLMPVKVFSDAPLVVDSAMARQLIDKIEREAMASGLFPTDAQWPHARLETLYQRAFSTENIATTLTGDNEHFSWDGRSRMSEEDRAFLFREAHTRSWPDAYRASLIS